MTHKYNEIAVNQAIKASRQPIGKREARLIHALLKGPTYTKEPLS
jgi:hypothetical protein